MSELVKASPTKRFFVDMLTRDIEVQDAILDLLDNCVDGILRLNEGKEAHEHPYAGFSAEINFDETGFTISDNCGGIPKDVAKNYAFMMGRQNDDRDNNLPTVGMYGIGMKRAIFKIGRSCTVKSFTQEEAFEVNINPDWMIDDHNWELELNSIENAEVAGTIIKIGTLPENIKTFFTTGSPIYDNLPSLISQHYSLIIKKGFTVTVNGVTVVPKDLSFLVSETGQLTANSISPFLYQGTINGVKVFLAVGFYKPMIDSDELEEIAKTKRSTEDAGWTIVCNDRIVLYNDKSILTGWGEAGVPSYHTQFIGVSGIVFFESNIAGNLPLTTTKRGVDASSTIYLRVKNYMRAGLKKFTDYTNHWKPYKDIQREISQSAISQDAVSLAKIVPDEKWSKVKGSETEMKIDQPLQKPKNIDTDPSMQIKFFRKKSDILKITDAYFEGQALKPSEIGSYCFDEILKSIEE